jgi:cyclopropane-fatty-acyl-phospholipid synthase
VSPAPPYAWPTISEQLVALVMSRLRHGELFLTLHNGDERHFVGTEPGPSARVHVNDPAAATRLLASTNIGLAEGYMAGHWDTPDLDAVLDLGLANLVDRPEALTPPTTPFQRFWHSLRDNSPKGSRRNIAHHYDLGNEFYRLWLDDTMAYSSAMFAEPTTDLTAAQVAKWDHLLDLLQLGANDRLLEIGCGWGGFAIHAAQRCGCRVTGITLSEEQRDWAMRAVAEEGLDDRIEIRLQDYRAVPETFDAIASIEMFEAVGERWWPVYFERVRDLLAPGGAAAIQTITIDERRFDDYRRKPDFIQRYIFPGGMLPSPERFQAIAETVGLTVNRATAFGASYARTLSEWKTRFDAATPHVLELGFDERFARMWRYYLAYCRAGFDAGTIDVMQVRLER